MPTDVTYTMRSGNEYLHQLPEEPDYYEAMFRKHSRGDGGFLGSTSIFSVQDADDDYLLLDAGEIEAVRLVKAEEE